MNKKELIPSRRPNSKHTVTAVDFTSCPYCKGCYRKTGLRNHVNYRCPNKPISNDKKIEGERFITASATATEARIHVNASDKLEEIFGGFRDDAVVRRIRFDWLVIVYGNKLSARHKSKPKLDQMIRYRMRLASRILHASQEIEQDLTEFAKLYHPKNIDTVIQAIRIVARLDNDRNVFEAPATASDAVTAIKQIGGMLKTEYIKRDDGEGQRITENFLTVFESEAPTLISRIVTETQARMKREKRVVLPALDDINFFRQYIDSEREKCFTELHDTFSYKSWKKLSDLTMASIVLFSRKRVGDVQNIEVADFERRQLLKDTSDLRSYENLSKEYKEIANIITLMTVLGKKGRNVDVLLKPDFEKAIQLLIDHRQDVGISAKNVYLFALPSSLTKYKFSDGCNIMKKLASECAAKNRSVLNGTLLRKQLATFCSSLDLTENQVRDVANFMGHSKEVHLNVYRQNLLERQIKISQILESAQGNHSVADSGKTGSIKETGGSVRKRKKVSTSDTGSKG